MAANRYTRSVQRRLIMITRAYALHMISIFIKRKKNILQEKLLLARHLHIQSSILQEIERKIKLKSARENIKETIYVFRACNIKHIIKSLIKDIIN